MGQINDVCLPVAWSHCAAWRPSSLWQSLFAVNDHWLHQIQADIPYWILAHLSWCFFFCQGLSKFAQTAHMFIHGLARFTNAWIGFGTMLQKIGYNSLLSWCLTSKISSLQALNSYHYRFVGFNIPKLYLPNLSRQPYWWNRWAFFLRSSQFMVTILTYILPTTMVKSSSFYGSPVVFLLRPWLVKGRPPSPQACGRCCSRPRQRSLGHRKSDVRKDDRGCIRKSDEILGELDIIYII